MAQSTRRDHPTGAVENGGEVVQSPAAAIEGFGGGRPKNVQTEFAPHPSTTADQLAHGRGHATAKAQPPAAPLVNLDGTGKTPRPTRAPAVSWGHESAPGGHDPAMGDAILKEAIPAGSLRLAGEVPHSCITGNDKPECED
jgi:hypothetical protein